MKQKKHLFFWIIFLFSLHSSARIGSLIPPETNPHPPQTDIEKEQVTFVEKALRVVFFNPLSTQDSPQTQNPTLWGSHSINFNPLQNLVCLKNSACLKKDTESVAQLSAIQRQLGVASEIKFVHIPPLEALNKIPRLQPLRLEKNQRLVHAYVRFGTLWVHADVILYERFSAEIGLSRQLYLERIILTGFEKGPIGC